MLESFYMVKFQGCYTPGKGMYSIFFWIILRIDWNLFQLPPKYLANSVFTSDFYAFHIQLI